MTEQLKAQHSTLRLLPLDFGYAGRAAKGFDLARSSAHEESA